MQNKKPEYNINKLFTLVALFYFIYLVQLIGATTLTCYTRTIFKMPNAGKDICTPWTYNGEYAND